MVKGLPKSIIKKYGITKKAWQVYRGRKKGKSTPSPRTRRKSGRKGGTVVRRRRSRRSMPKIPLGALSGVIGAAIVPAATSGGGKSILQNLLDGNLQWAGEALVENMTGLNPYTGKHDIMNARGTGAILVGAGVSMLASKFGLNRYIRLPLVKV